MAIQLIGNASVTAEVEANTRAMRGTVRPPDIGSLGSYGVTYTSGTMAAGLASNANIFAFQWTQASNIAIITRIALQAIGLGTAFAAGTAVFNLFVARSFTVAAASGTAVTLTGNNQKYRTSHGTSLVADARGSATAALTAGTWTLDATAIGSICGPASATGNALIVGPPGNPYLLDSRGGEYPLALAQNEGFTIQATVPATGTWQFSASVYWDELSSY